MRYGAVKRRCKEIAAASGFTNDDFNGDMPVGKDNNLSSKKKSTPKKRKTAGDETDSGIKKNKTAVFKYEPDHKDYSSPELDSSPLGAVLLKYEDASIIDESKALIKDEIKEES